MTSYINITCEDIILCVLLVILGIILFCNKYENYSNIKPHMTFNSLVKSLPIMNKNIKLENDTYNTFDNIIRYDYKFNPTLDNFDYNYSNININNWHNNKNNIVISQSQSQDYVDNTMYLEQVN